jgi:hypothetical protein
LAQECVYGKFLHIEGLTACFRIWCGKIFTNLGVIQPSLTIDVFMGDDAQWLMTMAYLYKV